MYAVFPELAFSVSMWELMVARRLGVVSQGDSRKEAGRSMEFRKVSISLRCAIFGLLSEPLYLYLVEFSIRGTDRGIPDLLVPECVVFVQLLKEVHPVSDVSVKELENHTSVEPVKYLAVLPFHDVLEAQLKVVWL